MPARRRRATDRRPRNGSHCFISWSGAESKPLAKAIKVCLDGTLDRKLECFVSTDIEAGKRWLDEIAKRTRSTDIGIIVATRRSLSSPWLWYEAGALSRSATARLFVLLVDVDPAQLPLPLSQYQSRQFTKPDFISLVQALAKRATPGVSKSDISDRIENTWWPQLEQLANEARKHLDDHYTAFCESTKCAKKNLSASVQELSQKIDELTKRSDLAQIDARYYEATQRLLKLAVAAPIYILECTAGPDALSRDFTVIGSNVASSLLLNIDVGSGKRMSFRQLLEANQNRIRNYKKVIEHHAEKFGGEVEDWPHFDTEDVEYISDRFGHVLLRKIAFKWEPARNGSKAHYVVAFNPLDMDPNKHREFMQQIISFAKVKAQEDIEALFACQEKTTP